MLNLITTSSARLAAMSTNKPYAEELLQNAQYRHRLEWAQLRSARTSSSDSSAAEKVLRKQTA